jgi:hypothetical protein
MDGLLAPSLRFLALGQWVAVAQLHWQWLNCTGSGWVAVVRWQWLWLSGCGSVAVDQWLWQGVAGCVMDGLLAPSLRFLALGQWLWLNGSGCGSMAVVKWQWQWLHGSGLWLWQWMDGNLAPLSNAMAVAAWLWQWQQWLGGSGLQKIAYISNNKINSPIIHKKFTKKKNPKSYLNPQIQHSEKSNFF